MSDRLPRRSFALLATLTTVLTLAPGFEPDARSASRTKIDARSASRTKIDARSASRTKLTRARAPSGPALPRVRLIATGGTISNRTGGRLSADELVASVPGIERYVRAESEQFANTSSSALSLEQWLGLARRINAVFAEDSELAGVVVTSGTDTLEETAYFLNLTVRSDKPVVVVGSMRNPSTLGYEGAANLLEGFRVAAEPQSRGKGVLVVLNDEINAAREVTKTDALRLQTFQTRGYGVLGVVDSRSRRLLPECRQAPHTRGRVRRCDDQGAAAGRRRHGVSRSERGCHQGDRRSGCEGHRDCFGRRRRHERNAGRRHPLRDRERCVRRHEHSRGRRTNCGTPAGLTRSGGFTGFSWFSQVQVVQTGDRGATGLPPKISRRSRRASFSCSR